MKFNVVARLVFLFLLVVGSPRPISVFAQLKEWNTTDGLWSNGANWTPFGPPSFVDLARIGNLPQAQNGDVTLDLEQLVGGLEITDGMTLHTGSGLLGVIFDTLVSGNNGLTNRSSLLIYRADEPWDFGSRDLILEDGAYLRLINGGILDVIRTMHVQSTTRARGDGLINLMGDDPKAFILDGELDPRSGGMTINQFGNGLIDLDGNFGNGTIQLDVYSNEDKLTINGTQLSDSFSGSIHMATGAQLNMNLSDGWTADANSYIVVLAHDGPIAPAQIQGDHWTFAGLMNVANSLFGSSNLQVNSDATIQNTAVVSLGNIGHLEFTGDTTINGGIFDIDEDATLDFYGPTRLHGGTLNTYSNLGSDGLVSFNGATEWNGNVTINGVARQNGTATVSGNTTINADVFDLDGVGGSTWNVNDWLVVNANGVDSSISNSFDGTINIAGGFLSRLTINLDQPNEHWTMAGEMNLANNQPFPITRLSGSTMRVTGDLNANGAGAAITADTLFENTAVVNFQDPASRLLMQGVTQVDALATFNGQGTLMNALDGEMMLADGVSLQDAGLVNSGLLEIGQSPGIAIVDRFENTSDGKWRVEIGGYASGSEFDVLVVGGDQALLDGTLEVDLIDMGNGLFLPQVGDDFTLLTSVLGISGEFDNHPISVAGGATYQWQVLYNPNDVTLRLRSIGAGPVFAEGSKLNDGVIVAGGLADVSASDDLYLELDPSPTSNLRKQKIHLILQSTSPTDTPSEFRFRLESAMLGGPSGDVVQTIELMNYDTGVLELVDIRSVANSDESIEVTPTGDLNRFVQPTTNEITAEITWKSDSFSGAPFTWSIDVDEAIWFVAE